MKINLISGPRNVSTALMYSFAQRSDTSVLDEPFYGCYLLETDADHPGKKEVIDAQSTDAVEVMAQIEKAESHGQHLFIKNMAHHLSRVPRNFLASFRNIFLIREPEEMLLSFIKKIPNPSIGDTAYPEQHQLFTHVTEQLQQEPIVLDSTELLKNPRRVLMKACVKLGIPFEEAMLRWEKGPIEAEGVWAPYWYQQVRQSTGFNPYTPKKGTVPERMDSLLEACRRYYSQLYEHAIKSDR